MISIELKPDSAEHKHILEALNSRKKFAEQEMARRIKSINRIDEDYVAFVPESEMDAERNAERDDGNPQYTTLNIPYSYAMLLSAHTYLSSVFLSRDPVHQFTGLDGKPEMNRFAVEALIDYQVSKGKMLPPYYIWLMDILKYGLGVMWEYWEVEERHIPEMKRQPAVVNGIEIPERLELVKTMRKVKKYAGNKAVNVHPCDHLPDARVPLSQPEKGEFVGRKIKLRWNDVLRKGSTGQYTNLDKMKQVAKSKSGAAEMKGWGDTDTAAQAAISTSNIPAVPTVEGYEMIVELVPKDWKLGSGTLPELWVFTVADDKVIIEARPQENLHGEYPVTVGESEIEGYQLHKRGQMEIVQPLQDSLNWLMNMHFFNVRNQMNGTIIWDPTRLRSADILDPAPGKRIRMKPEAYGQDIRSMIHVVGADQALTQNHLQDARVIEQLAQKVTGVNDNMMGALNQGGRKTASEVRISSSNSLNRMKSIAEYISATSFSGHAQRILQNSQQFFDAEMKLKIVGDNVHTANEFVSVDPDLISGAFGYQPVDGTLPIDKHAMVNTWSTLLAQIRNFPDFGQQYRVSDMIAWVAQLAGLKNIRQFRINVTPDGVIPPGTVPMGGNSGARREGSDGGQPGGATFGAEGGTVRSAGPAQVPGVGPTG